MAGGHQIEKGRYGLAMLNFLRFDKSLLIAVINARYYVLSLWIMVCAVDGDEAPIWTPGYP